MDISANVVDKRWMFSLGMAGGKSECYRAKIGGLT